MFETILVALESSELDDALLEQVLRLTWREDANIVLLHVVDPEGGAEYEGADVSITLRHQAAERRLLAAQDRFQAKGLSVAAKVMLGDPKTLILSQAKVVNAGLIALATHGRRGPKRWFSGSVSEAVLRGTTLPVLITNPSRNEAPSTRGFKRVLVPLDGSQRSARILPQVRAFAQLYEASITLLRVGIYPVVPPMDVPLAALEQVTPLRDAYQKELEGFAAQLPGTSDVRVAFSSSAANGVLEVLQEGSFDLVAMATHGRGGLDRLLFGSTAETIVRSSPVPLLVWRDTQGEDT